MAIRRQSTLKILELCIEKPSYLRRAQVTYKKKNWLYPSVRHREPKPLEQTDLLLKVNSQQMVISNSSKHRPLGNSVG